MKILLAIPLLLLAGCSNLSTTRFTYTHVDGSSTTVELPKEVDAVNLSVQINAKEGIAVITAREIYTRNQGTIEAGGRREANNISKAGDLVEKTAEGVTEGAIKGLKGGIP